MRLPGVTAFFRKGGQAPALLLSLVVGSAIPLMRLPLQPALGANAPFILAWPGMMFAAAIGGFWPALAVGALGLAIGQWALVEGGGRLIGPWGVAIYFAFVLIFGAAGEALKRGRRRARADAARIAELQSQMVNVARLNAVGEMAGSLAHELNQPLTAITNYLNATEQILSHDDRNKRSVELIRKAADQAVRAGRIVARVRASVDRADVVLNAESLSGLTRDAVEAALAGRADESLQIRYEFDRAADLVLADRLQIQQVVLNLARNAVEAMADGPDRELRIGSRAAEPGVVEVCVADSGPGIAPHLADRLFQPFVSDKPGGMGVGLSISRSIVEAHGGRIWAQDGERGGAAFHFTLRQADGEPRHER